MTSASELFSTRRSRPGRSDPVLEPDSSLNRYNHHHNHHRRHGVHQRHDSNGFARNPPRLRRFCHHLGFSERSRHVGNVQGVNSVDLETQSDSFGNLNGSERLPGSVLLARARLVERLRGVSLSDYSRGTRDLLGEDQRESSLNLTIPDTNFQSEGLHVSCNKKPEGLTQEAINGLHRQTFNSAEVKTEMRDCSICLESFTKGDKLITLPCTHSFHSPCLNPWLRACGDCPYCRRAIIAKK